jgi:hypothetical protein
LYGALESNAPQKLLLGKTVVDCKIYTLARLHHQGAKRQQKNESFFFVS